MNEIEVFNQKLHEIGGKEILEGISIRGINKEKILDFINANSCYKYILDKNDFLIQESNKLKENPNLDIKAETFLDIQIKESLQNNMKILIAFNTKNVSQDVEVLMNNDQRIILLNPNLYIVDDRFIEVTHNENVKITKDLLYSEELTDRLIKAFHNNRLLETRSSTAIIGIMTQNQNVYHGPHLTQYAMVGSVDAGEQVYILSKAFGFYHIQYIVTSTGKQKQGYVPQESIQNYTGPMPEEEDYYGGYCFATTELDVRTCDDFNLTAPVGTLFKHEGCTMIFHYNFVDGDRSYHVAYIEYSTSSGTKRGYVYNQYLSFPVSTCVAVMKEKADVYSGPNVNYTSIGVIAENEFVSIIAKEGDDIYVEYNTNSGRKRGYIKYNQVNPYNRPESFPDFYQNGMQSYIIDERCIVYGGPNSNYSELGAVRNEEVTCFNTNKLNLDEYTFEYTCIEYTVYPSGQRKRGYVLASKVINGNLPEENNPIENFDKSYPFFGSKIIYGQTQKGRNLFYYKTGSGINHLFLIFALHGWEDGTKADGTYYHGDGNMLLKIAKRFMINFSNITGDKLDDIRKKWTIYVFPGINLDGIANGNSINGFGRCLYNRLDPNRNWGGNFMANDNNPRYKTSSEPFQAKELENLRDELRKNIGVGKNILIDTHGWYNQTVGSSNLGQFYWDSMEIPSSRHSSDYGKGYLIAWAKNSPSMVITDFEHPGLGAESCLLELTPTTDYSDSNMNSYGDKFFNGTLNMLENTSIVYEDSLEDLYNKLERLYDLASSYKSDASDKEKNNLVLQFLRHTQYNSGWEFNYLYGNVDEDFVNYVKTNASDLANPETITVPTPGYRNISIPHLAATINGFTHSNIFDSEHNSLGGWAGDLLQLGGQIEEKNLTLNDFQINGLLASTDDGYAKECGFETSESAGFSYADWVHDIDAVNLYIEIINGVKIHLAFKDYYSGNAFNKKYETFLKRTIPGGATDRESVLEYVKKYTTPNSLATATIFGKHFGYNGKNGDALAEAFTNKIMAYYEEE